MPKQNIIKLTKQNLKGFSLFLDRDGVINEKLDNDYVKYWKEFKFIDGALETLKVFNNIFERIVIVTNQQGIGKSLMSEKDLNVIHNKMLEAIEKNGGRIDQIYHAPNLVNENSVMRKPNTGMALRAQKDFPEIDFSKAVIVGDSATDIQMGRKLGMICVAISNIEIEADYHFESLAEIAELLEKE